MARREPLRGGGRVVRRAAASGSSPTGRSAAPSERRRIEPDPVLARGRRATRARRRARSRWPGCGTCRRWSCRSRARRGPETRASRRESSRRGGWTASRRRRRQSAPRSDERLPGGAASLRRRATRARARPSRRYRQQRAARSCSSWACPAPARARSRADARRQRLRAAQPRRGGRPAARTCCRLSSARAAAGRRRRRARQHVRLAQAARNAVIERPGRTAAGALRLARTSLADAQVNAVTRMVARYGRLLDGDELKAAARPIPALRPRRAVPLPARARAARARRRGSRAIDVVAFERRRRSRVHEPRGRSVWYDGVVRRSRSGPRAPVVAGRRRGPARPREALRPLPRRGLAARSACPGIRRSRRHARECDARSPPASRGRTSCSAVDVDVLVLPARRRAAACAGAASRCPVSASC